MAIAANKVRGVRAAPAEYEDEVRLTREHNDANVLTLGARYIGRRHARGSDPRVSEHASSQAAGTRGALAEIAAIEDAQPAAGIGETRISMTAAERMARPLAEVDPEVYEAIQHEVDRQDSQLELIASENFTSEAVLEATGQRLHQQVRRRLSRQALLRRLRVHRHGREPGPRPRQEAVRRRARQRAAALRLAGQPGRVRRRAASPATPSWA